MDPILRMLVFVLLGALAGYGIYLAFFQPAPIEAPTANLTNLTPPINGTPAQDSITVTFIEAPDCGLCNSDNYVMKQARTIILQRTEVPFGSERTLQASDPEAEALISKYAIPVLPVVIAEGPVDDYPDLISHWTQTLGYQSGDALLSVPFPPYHDLASGETVGILEAVAINPSDCRWCSDGGSFLASLQSMPASMVFSDTKTYSQDDPEAVELIARHNITSLPTILVSEEIQAYPIYPELAAIGDISEGWFVLRLPPPPFVDVQANETRGMVKTIYLFDQSCTECFDIRGFASYLSEATGLVIEQETYFDVRADDGAALARQYNVTHIPTLLLSSDADYYPGFKDVWLAQGNVVAEDGWYVFQAHELLGNMTYKNFTG